mmetsp:Transcript_18579/g.20196  ORF Transcript_18579/g.20196 Transcript_18579/m.20196 type:complete len:916 (-) Transcript_18579:34-2781(-)
MAEIDLAQLFPEVDKLQVEVDMMDFSFVESCSDWKQLLKILQVLKSGKEGHYPELVRSTEEKLLRVMPAKEKKRYTAINATASPTEAAEAGKDLIKWIQQTHSIDTSLKQTGAKNEDSTILLEEENNFLEFNLSKAQFRKVLEARDKFHVEKFATPFQRTNKAEIERRKGNDCFKAKDFEGAILYYTNAIALHPFAESAWTNRALAYLKKELFDQAEGDCNVALKLNPTSIKAVIRRGSARLSSGKYELAAKDFQHGLELEPANADVDKLLAKALERYEETEGKPLSFSVTPIEKVAPVNSSSVSSASYSEVAIGTADSIDELLIPSSEMIQRGSGVLSQFSLAELVKEESGVEVEGTDDQFIRIQIEDEEEDEVEHIPIHIIEEDEEEEGKDGVEHIPIHIVEEEEDEKEKDEEKATRLKEEGDAHVKRGEFADAIHCYDVSLRLHFSINTLNNRCLAKLSNKEFEMAIEDATEVLKIEGSNLKARFRRAHCLLELGEFSSAESDIEEILTSEPNNSAAQQLAKEVKEKKAASEQREKESEDAAIQLSEALKNEGNEVMKTGDYLTAIEKYTLSIEQHPYRLNLASFNNRSLAHLKRNDLTASISDATVVIDHLQKATQDSAESIDDIAFQQLKKAFYRRSEARLKQSQSIAQSGVQKELLHEALSDVESFLSMEADNQQGKSLKQQILKALSSSTTSPSPTTPTMLQKTPTKDETKEPIKVNGSDSSTKTTSLKKESNVPDNLHDKESTARASSNSIIKSEEKEKEKVLTPSPSSTRSKSRPTVEYNVQVPESVPKTLYEFERVWRSLQHHSALRLQYLQGFKKSTFKKIFKASMPTETLGEIVDVLHEAKSDEKTINKTLKALIDIPSLKFSITLLPSEQQEKLNSLLVIVRSNKSEGSPMDSEEFRQVFSL